MPNNTLIKYHSYIRQGWVVLILIVVGVPLASWVYHAPLRDAFGSTFFTLKLVGQITGIIGAQLFAFALILSARLHFLEKLFGGLDKLYNIHHRVGAIAFAFLAVHPMVIASSYATDSFSELRTLPAIIASTPSLMLGVLSLSMMLGLLFLTFYGSAFSYPKLKTAHKFLGAAFFLGFLHVLFIPSSLNSDALLKISLIGTSSLGLLAYTYRTLFGKWLVKRYDYTVRGVKDLGNQMTEITLEAKDLQSKKMYHIPGQFGMLSLVSSVVPKEEHPFTISSSGVDGTVRFSIKDLGDYTKALAGVHVGTKALIEGPFGEFSYLYGTEKQVWVAGGIGVTPFVSMAEHLLTQETIPYTVDFFYSSRTEEDAVYVDLFNKVVAKHPTFMFHPIPSDTKGFISGELLFKEVKELHSRDIFICGPPGLMTALTGQLVGLGIQAGAIKTERFALLR